METSFSYNKNEANSRYPYTLNTDYNYILPDYFLPTWVELETRYLWYNGAYVFIMKEGYAWNGPSGPTIHTKSFMRGSLVHDALYQFMRLGYLEKNKYGKDSDRILYDICREDGMWWARANWVYYAVRIGANRAAMRKLHA